MSVLLRLLALAVVAGLLLAALLPAWLACLGFDTQDLADSFGAWQRESGRAAQLDARSEVVRDRLLTTERITQELIEGRLTLEEAARRLCELHEEVPLFWQVLRLEEGTSDEERLCRHLIDRAGIGLSEDPERARAVAWRLEGELEELLARRRREP
jgi:hypothetical protein